MLRHSLPCYARLVADSWAWMPVIAFIAMFVGCGGGSGGASVTGEVTFNGAPVTTGVIGFLQTGSPMLGGPLGPDGTYSLTIPPGDYKVRIDAPAPWPEGWKEGDPQPKLPPRPVPEQYAHFDSSGLTATITGDSSQKIDFTLP